MTIKSHGLSVTLVVGIATTLTACSGDPVDSTQADAPQVSVVDREGDEVPDEVRSIPGFMGVLEERGDVDPATATTHDLPGDRGTTTIAKPGWWREWEGVAPETPGGHTEYPLAVDKTCGGAPGEEFGEYCTSGGHLVESNPDATDCHFHKDGVGHPYVFNCNEYCLGTGRASGSCEAANATSPYTGAVIASARCKCVPWYTPRTGTDVWRETSF